MSNDIKLMCPNCGVSESAPVGQTLRIGADIDVTVNRIRCRECEYVGENGEVDLD